MGSAQSARAFTLIELLVVIAILGILASVVLATISSSSRSAAYFSRTKLEFRQMELALWLYAEDHGTYPDDVDRGLPNGLETYLSNPTQAGAWPNAPYPGSVYDWDNWIDPVTGEHIYQISVRFCPVGGPLSACHFPNESWASNFNVDSALYYCLAGPCRSHINEPINYPGYCVNC